MNLLRSFNESVRDTVYTLPGGKPLKEVVLEVLRWLLFIGISAMVSALLQLVSGLEPSTTTMILTIVLRAADKWLFEHRKETPSLKGGKAETPMGLTF